MPAAAVSLSPAGAKAARQKKMVIAGAVVLVVVLAIQGPKMLKLFSGGSTPAAAPAPATPVTPTPVTPTPVTPSAPSTATVDRLVSFETFESKDPFIQQVGADTGSGATQSAAGSTGTTGTTSGTSAGTTGTASASSSGTTSSGSEPAGGTLAAGAGFTVAGSETTPPASPQLASASLQVNSQVETVDEGETFPRSDPVFKLVKVSDGAIEIAIADGSLKAGSQTLKVSSSKPVTLKNTSSGKRYRIEVISTTPKS